MTENEFNSLTPGLYRVWWIDGAQTLAAMGATLEPDSPRWLAPVKWGFPTPISVLNPSAIARMELLYTDSTDVDREQARVRELEKRLALLEGVFNDLIIDNEALQLAYQKGVRDKRTRRSAGG